MIMKSYKNLQLQHGNGSLWKYAALSVLMHDTYLPIQVSLYVAFDNKPNLDPILIRLLTRQTN